ncbi:unnamed protein product [Paramecium pentaurelia]|uniref:Uncharacterized protein n=1 Tax=Paramecium pentaurelia TaxID=43138 RepID=A0A8S1XEI2_9CILI|nr:unnamed protein product [Paramecium pentaurelia]
MAVNLKLGNNLFTKERRIAELEKKVVDLEHKVQEYEKLNFEFQLRHKEDEKNLFALRNQNNLYQIEVGQLQAHSQKLTLDKEKLEVQLKEINGNYEKLKEKQKEIMNIVTNQSNEINENLSLIDKLKSDLTKSENAQIQLEKQIHELCLQREAKIADIRTLQKSIQQKEKYIAVLNKEKEKSEENKDKENKMKEQKKGNCQFKSSSIIDGLDDVESCQTIKRLKNKQK